MPKNMIKLTFISQKFFLNDVLISKKIIVQKFLNSYLAIQFYYT